MQSIICELFFDDGVLVSFFDDGLLVSYCYLAVDIASERYQSQDLCRRVFERILNFMKISVMFRVVSYVQPAFF